MLVLPISMASNMTRISILQWNHIPGDDPLFFAVVVNQHQSAIAIDACGGADGDLIERLHPHAPVAPGEITLPALRQSSESGLFKLSITPLDTLKQSS
jgi:hypothetical protein